MKFGIKLWSTNNSLYKEAVKLFKEKQFDYLELKYFLGKNKNLDLIKKNKIPVVLHAQNYVDGLCFSDGNLKKNLEALTELEKTAHYLQAEGIIIHPEIGAASNFLQFLKKINSDKIIIENMPKIASGKETLGYNPEEIEEFLSAGNFRFCLDFGHAIKSAVAQGIDIKEHLKNFMKLDPCIFHICDGRLNSNDEHLSLGDGDFDLKFIKQIIKKSNCEKITFEVPKTTLLENDLKSIRFFREL